MGSAAGLPDGGAELRGGAFTARQENGARAAGAEAEIVSAIAFSRKETRQIKLYVRKPQPAPRARRSGCARPWSAGRWNAVASGDREIRIRRIRQAHPLPGSEIGRAHV